MYGSRLVRDERLHCTRREAFLQKSAPTPSVKAESQSPADWCPRCVEVNESDDFKKAIHAYLEQEDSLSRAAGDREAVECLTPPKISKLVSGIVSTPLSAFYPPFVHPRSEEEENAAQAYQRHASAASCHDGRGGKHVIAPSAPENAETEARVLDDDDKTLSAANTPEAVRLSSSGGVSVPSLSLSKVYPIMTSHHNCDINRSGKRNCCGLLDQLHLISLSSRSLKHLRHLLSGGR